MAGETCLAEYYVPRVPETIEFSKEEENILELWKTLDAFKTCLKQSKGKPKFSFYDGPPFATGLPHYGHILAGTIKDVITRYAHQQGYHVERRFGWDCHGLPVEFEIDKTLGIKGPEDVMKIGIENYNNECRNIVMRYSKDWEIIIGRMGRWIDFQNDYKTLYPWYMESIWWVFKELFNKGLVYQGVKVMPFSTACNTPLSNFESGQNYKEVVDPAVIISFPLVDSPDQSLLAWTTTPWTLPSNMSLCVNPQLIYAKVKDLASGSIYILMECRLEILYKNPDQYQVLETFPGSKLENLKYKPLFPYFIHRAAQGAFRILTDSYVSEASGTGVVHQAPYFGEDDYRINLAAGIISRDGETVCPVDSCGRFTLPVTDFVGQYVKDADKNIISWLKNAGRLVQNTQTKHSYPFCWRSDTPLIYKAIPSWFIRVEQMQESLLKSSAATYWVPEVVKEKRFGNWLREAHDWAVSRNRYWGTPIPIWISEDGEEVVCVGSIKELKELTGVEVTDLHREIVDKLEIPSRRPGKSPLKRIPEVFDCWFESGSMPYAQQHYPFENQKEFKDYFPAHFIAEGIDQTRGWFYTLLVISTALFDKAPFKNLIANGLVLAADGQKMSKRKKNYPDPMQIVNKYGADALRLYLINSPVVHAENLRFKEEGVRDVIKDVFLPWYNAFRFLMQNIESYVQDTGIKYKFNEMKLNNSLKSTSNMMDRWILSYTQSLLDYVRKEMAAYRLYTVVPRLTKFIDNLTNWYVRMNRKRLKGEGGPVDCGNALDTLFGVLITMVKMMAPFAPFISELMYQSLNRLCENSSSIKDSVHYQMLPDVNSSLIDNPIERAISRMQNVIELGRVLRDRKTIPIKYPLPELVVVHRETEFIDDLLSLKPYVLSELNVRKITVSTDKEKYGVTLRAEPDHKILGLRLKLHFKAVTQAIKLLTDEQVQKFIKDKHMIIEGHRIELEEIRVIFNTASSGSDNKYEANSDNDVLILLDVTPDDSMLDEGTAREIINRVQKLRKKAHLVPTDEIKVYYEADGELSRVSVTHKEFIENTIKALFEPLCNISKSSSIIIEESQNFKSSNLKLVITSAKEITFPVVKWANVELFGLHPRCGASKEQGMILLENPIGNKITFKQLNDIIKTIFGLYGCRISLWVEQKKIVSDDQISQISGKVIAVTLDCDEFKEAVQVQSPFKNFINVKCNGHNGTLILENSRKEPTVYDIANNIAKLFQINKEKIKLSQIPKAGETLSI